MLQNFKKRFKKEQNEREKKQKVVALRIIKEVGNYEEILLGNYSSQEANKSYKDIVQKIKAIFLEEDILMDDINIIFKMMSQPYSEIQRIINDNFNKHLTDAGAKLWGKEMIELTISDLHKVLED